MDLNLYLGLPRSPRHLRSVVLGSGLDLASPSPSPSPPPPEEHLAPPSAGMSAAPEPYSPSRALIAAAAPDPPLAADHRPPPFAGGDPIPEYSPRSPSYQSFATPYVPYDPLSTAGLADEPLLGGGRGGGGGGGAAHVRYSPSYLPLSAIPEDHDDVNFAPYRPIDVGSADIFEGHDGSSLHPDFVEPEFRFRRLIELQRRARDGRPVRSSRPYGDGPPDYAIVEEMMVPDGYAGSPRKNNVDGGGIRAEGLEEKLEKNASAVHFECNICLDLAQEPVVTSCGHLFCWPCLYQWLHLHCNHSECPVCKGEVIESSITPIYGRGNPGTSSQEARDGDSGVKIPPRPRGRRIESWRQRIRRPISRRFSVGIANTWRRVLGEEMHIGSRVDGDVEASLREMINSAHRRVAPRLRLRRSAREANLENASFSIDHSLPSRNAPSNRQGEGNSSSVLGDGLNHWPRFSFVGFDGSSGLASISANLSRIFGRSADSGGHSGAPESSGNPQISDDLIRRPSAGPSQLVDQASASSTMAVIQEDGGIMDVAVEPNSAGTSRPFRRRGRSSSSLDIDGCALHARKRRRVD